MRSSFGILLVIVMVLALIVFVPLILIWALSTLLPITISYTFINWFAALVLLVLLNANNN